MRKKKKKTTVKTVVTTSNTLIKMSYLQTLAIASDLANVEELETESSTTNLGSSSKKKDTSLLGLGLSSKKTSVSAKLDSSGQKIKDEWLQPEFDRIRYAIGIRELTAAAYTFAPKSEFVSVAYGSPKEVIKVHIIVDQYIPPQFDQNQTWIEYYIKPEGTTEWIRVQPLNGPTKFDINGEIIPKIINFNIPKPTTAQLEDKYQTTNEPVNQFRFKAVFTRPEGGNNDSITPLLKSYRMIMTPRD